MRFQEVILTSLRLQDQEGLATLRADAGWELERDITGGCRARNENEGFDIFLPPGSGWYGQGVVSTEQADERLAFITKRLQQGASHAEVARELGITRSRVSQIAGELKLDE